MTIENRVSIHANIAAMKHFLTMAVCLLGTGLALADLVNDVRCREIGFSQSAENRDIAAFKSFIDADARFVASSVLRGPDDVTAAWSVFFKPDGPAIRWRPQIVEVLENGTLALSRGPFRTESVDADGNTVVAWGTFNSVWRLHEDGEWRIVFDAGSPAASEPDEETKALLYADSDC